MSSPVMNDQNEGQDDQDVEVLDDRVAGENRLSRTELS